MARLQFHGSCKVNMAANTFAANSGAFASVAHPGAAGTVNVNLDPDFGIDDLECICKIEKRGAAAASGMVSYGYIRPSDVQIQISAVQEQAGGAASILADVDFDLSLWRIIPD